MARTLEEAEKLIEEQQTSISKLETTNKNLKDERDLNKESIKNLKEENETFKDSAEELNTFKKEQSLKEAKDFLGKEFKGKDKFTEDILKRANIENFDSKNITKEQKDSIKKVMEENPEFKQTMEDNGGKAPVIDPELIKAPAEEKTYSEQYKEAIAGNRK